MQLYRYVDLLLLATIMLQDPVKSGISTELLGIIIGFIVGFSPILITAIKEKVKWKTEKTVVQGQANINQTEAIENIAQAASILLDQSHQLTDKNASLVQVFEEAFKKQEAETLRERVLRMEQEKNYMAEIDDLKRQIDEINKSVRICTREIISIITDLRDGVPIDADRIEKLESKWIEE